MSEFTDDNGGRWPLVIDIQAVKRSKIAQPSAHLGKPEVMLPQALRDFEILVDNIWAICETPKLSIDDLANGIRGDAQDAAYKALVDAVVDFFPGRRGAAIRATADADILAVTEVYDALMRSVSNGPANSE